MKNTLLLASLGLVAALSACAAADKEDTKLSLEVAHDINSHPALESDLLRVDTADRVVYLRGAADSWLEYYEAETIARAVPGVLRVVNTIEVKGPRV